jgi:hypothetical protein
MKSTLKLLALTSAIGVVGAANALTLDGNYKAAYGSPIVLQDTQTQFGDANATTLLTANGSELNGAYAYRDWEAVYLFIPGNIESNYNRFVLFFDGGAAGQNRILAGQSDINFGSVRKWMDDGSGNGLTFDAGFAADTAFILNGGDTGGGVYKYFADMAIVGNESAVLADNPWNRGGVYLGNYNAGGWEGGQGDFGLRYAINNSNLAGVDGGNAITALASTGTASGFEIKIPVGLLAAGNGSMKVSGIILSGDASFASNQVLGGIGGGDNLANPRAINFANIPGDQFFTVPAASGSFRTLTGTLQFDGEAHAIIPADLKDSSGNLISRIALRPDSAGNYAINLPGNDAYTLESKPLKYVSKQITIPAGSGNVVGNFNLRVGDIDMDSEVSILDYITLSSYYGSAFDSADPGAWRNGGPNGELAKYRADLDGDNEISILDYILLSSNYALVDNQY